MRKRELARRLRVAKDEIKSLEERVIDLETELSDDMKTVTVLDRDKSTYFSTRPIYKEEKQITLSGKVEKIIEHLGLDITVLQKECTPAKVTVSTVKKKARK